MDCSIGGVEFISRVVPIKGNSYIMLAIASKMQLSSKLNIFQKMIIPSDSTRQGLYTDMLEILFSWVF